MKDERNRYWSDPETCADPDGLVGVGGNLRPATLIRAYSEGVFPWFNDDTPILWWSPDPRGIIELDGLHISKSLNRTLRSGKFRVTFNQDFSGVMRGCTEKREDGTWITREMIEAYEALHRLGSAHSLETWVRDSTESVDEEDGWVLAGGIYGVSIGGFFAGESMFHRVTDASKVALASLTAHLKTRGFLLFDIQMRTEHTTRMGAVEIDRATYLRRLREAVRKTDVRFT